MARSPARLPNGTRLSDHVTLGVLTATIIILFNLIADVLYGYLDPRIRYD